jgi:hypothetical protein
LPQRRKNALGGAVRAQIMLVGADHRNQAQHWWQNKSP